MRIVGNFSKENHAKRFSVFLRHEGIENSIEIQFDPEKKVSNYTIWVLNEDELEIAKLLLSDFLENPDDDKFRVSFSKEPSQEKEEPYEQLERPHFLKINYPFKYTYFIILLCTFLFIIDTFQAKYLEKKYNLKQMILLTPLQTALLFDVTKSRTELDNVIIQYHLDSEEMLKNPPPDALHALTEVDRIPEWIGLYDILLEKIKVKTDFKTLFGVPYFEKIHQGEFWRLLTPVFLHGGILHILFNMLWVLILGKQIEPRIRFLRYLLLILATATISNTAQYLMSGPNFVGYSGVITGMAGFIWSRQKIAPWEGYPLQKPIINFLAIFILAVFGLQFVSFVLELLNIHLLSGLIIANTAHIVGALVGIILGRIPFFAWRVDE
ncbi:MAG: rhomboid family intramembrane serine protease [Chlamydiae bacterium]|nr:rhomboid family intramembrane serine protease [Chlamydiota bacterium]